MVVKIFCKDKEKKIHNQPKSVHNLFHMGLKVHTLNTCKLIGSKIVCLLVQ